MPGFAGEATVQLVSIYHFFFGHMSDSRFECVYAPEYTVIRGILTMVG